ncbi:hypothetical protein KBD13_02625, partial [Patescibacteria group bacterium]|nr:hypothetical protein [Patescibacteria group bacterium]
AGKRGKEIGFAKHEDDAAPREALQKQLQERLRDHFRPEFLNRIDETVVFHALAPEHLSNIIGLQTTIVAKRLQEKKITLTFTPAAEELLAKRGYDPQFGARPLKRIMQELVLDRLALAIVDGTIHEGMRVTVDAENQEIRFVTDDPIT